MTHATPSPHPAATKRSTAACWVEAMRLRTLPVSVAGVLAATALAIINNTFRWLPAIICLVFAILAQIASNFANEYFDFRDGLDSKGRIGPRRGVTEGDITPAAMRNAALATLGGAALIGCTLIWWGGWWLVLAGVAIVLGALAYSAGPYPLSRHGLGEVAVILFFGIAPVTLTYWVQAGSCPSEVWLTSVAIGLLGANVLIVNNYRDREEDAAVGKTTLAVKFGPKFASALYLVNGILAVCLTVPVWRTIPAGWCEIVPAIFTAMIFFLWRQLRTLRGSALNPLLGRTAIAMLLYTITLLIAAILSKPMP